MLSDIHESSTRSICPEIQAGIASPDATEEIRQDFCSRCKLMMLSPIMTCHSARLPTRQEFMTWKQNHCCRSNMKLVVCFGPGQIMIRLSVWLVWNLKPALVRLCAIAKGCRDYPQLHVFSRHILHPQRREQHHWQISRYSSEVRETELVTGWG